MAYERPKLPPFYATDKSDWEPQTFRASPEHERVIADAAEKLGLVKAHWMLQAVVERSIQVLDEAA